MKQNFILYFVFLATISNGQSYSKKTTNFGACHIPSNACTVPDPIVPGKTVDVII